MNDPKLDPIFTEWPAHTSGPPLQNIPIQCLVSDSELNALRQLRQQAKHFNFATGDSYSFAPPTQGRSVLFHDAAYGRCNYAAIERRIAKSIGPRAPKRKRRKRLAKKIKQRGGMLKTCGIVQSYFDAWPEMRFWWGR